MAIPISKNKVVHTGANSRLGGLKDGLINVGYHDLTAGVVKNDPIIPANSHIIILINNFPKFFIYLVKYSSCESRYAGFNRVNFNINYYIFILTKIFTKINRFVIILSKEEKCTFSAIIKQLTESGVRREKIYLSYGALSGQFVSSQP